MLGVEERDTKSGIHVFRVHYMADPLKREPDWQEDAAAGMPGGKKGKSWRREMEIDWTVTSGLGVYSEEFNRSFHVAGQPLKAIRNLPIYRGWDFGLTPACAWVQVDAMGRIRVLAEHVTWDGRKKLTSDQQRGIERFTPECVLISNQDWPGAEWADYADPAGWGKSQTDEKTCVDIMHKFGVHPRQGPVTWTARKAAMVQALQGVVAGEPKLLIDPSCHMLIEGFEGAYRYEEIGETGRYKETVEKNAWSHVMNALEYVVGALFAAKPDQREYRRKSGRPDKFTGY